MPRKRRKNPTASNKAERKWYAKNKDYKRKRANSRNKARRKLGHPAGDVHHKDGNPSNNSKKNLAVTVPYHGRKTYSRKKPTKMRHRY